MRRSLARARRVLGAAVFILAVAYAVGVGLTASSWLVPAPAAAQQGGEVPGGALGGASDSELWRAVRQGDRFQVSIPDRQAGVLVQSEGDNWRALRNGPLSVYSGWAMAAIVVLLVVFFLLRGRIRVEHGMSGRNVERFNGVERFAHWLLAISFIVLALTGLNVMFGRYLFGGQPTPSGEVDALHALFASVTLAGKFVHNFVAYGFMIGLAMIFVLWVVHNFPNRHDVVWLLKGGGLFTKGVHPPAKKFNAGQKIVFWLVILGGLSLSLSGIALMFPFKFAMFSSTFGALNVVGFDLPTNLSAMQEMQYSQLWHAMVAVAMIVVIIAHIYIGTLGQEGAFWAMGTGYVDENWAREHHALWAEEVLGSAPASAAAGETATAGGDD